MPTGSACAAKCRLSKLVARLNQVHGNDVHAATRDTAGLRPAGDGIVTAEPGVMLGIFTADCVPILMVDAKRKIAGALHAGWRGVIADIARAGVHAMVQLGARASDIRAAMGPSIGQCCFEVDAELGDRFSNEIEGARNHIEGRAPRQGVHRLARHRARSARTRGTRAREHRERRSVHAMRIRAIFLATRRWRKDDRLADELRRLRRVARGDELFSLPRRDFPCYSYLVERRFDAAQQPSPSCSPSRSGRG